MKTPSIARPDHAARPRARRCRWPSGPLAAVAAAPRRSTLDNLQAAFNGESNANARYLAFAKKADEEGYGQVASLFRAAARAEEIHAANARRS